MFLFVVGTILLVAAILALALAASASKKFKAKMAEYKIDRADYLAERKSGHYSSYNEPKEPKDHGVAGALRIISAVAAVVAITCLIFATTYRQDEGHASVMRSFSGKVIGEPDTSSGMGTKAPWVKAIKFDTRDNQLTYTGLSFSDKNGTSGAIDLNLTYNLIPAKTGDVYREYKTQKGFEERRVAVDVPASLRAVTPKFSNVEMMTKPNEVAAAVMADLTKRWESWGVQGVQISLGTPAYSSKINERLENLTAEQTRAEEAKAATVTAEEKAKQRLVEAKAEAEANNLMEKSLSGKVLDNRRIEVERLRVETLKTASEHGNMIITDGGAQPLLNVDTKATK